MLNKNADKMDIEKYITEHSEEFDVELPSEKVWSGISKKLHQKSKSNAWKPYLAAASVMLFIASTWLITYQKFEITNASKTIDVSAEVNEAQVQFSSLIEIKKNELNQYKKSNPDLVRDFEKQLYELQLSYSELIPLLKDEKKKEVVLQAIIDNLQIQIAVLNQQIEIIKQIKKSKNETEKTFQL